jgi:hypothetical protein
MLPVALGEVALSRARRRGAYTAQIDLFRVSDAAELAEALAAAVIANRSAAHRALRRARSAGRAALTAAGRPPWSVWSASWGRGSSWR